MTSRRYGLLFGIITLGLIGVKSSFGQGSNTQFPHPEYITEGRDPIYFSTQCVTGSWNLAVSSDSISRSLFVIAPSSNTSVVCISSGPTNANTCTQATPSDEIQPGGSETIYNRAAIYCRSGGGTQFLKGHRNRDHGDFGQTSIP